LDLSLKQSNAKWKIVVGHHTIRSAGHHRDTEELVDQLLPILEVIKMHSPNIRLHNIFLYLL
jgi:tartrate-resistant acid phosphatase type 5